MQNSPYINPTGGCPTGSSRWSACKTARTSTLQAGAPLRERDFACKTARAPALTTALRMTELRPGASTSPARSRANAGPHRGRQQATGAGNRAMETAHWSRQQAIGAGNRPPGQATEQWKRHVGAGNRPSEQATGHRSRQFAYPNRRFPTPLPVSCPNTAHRTRKGCTEHPAPP